jgi:hypothetical protein
MSSYWSRLNYDNAAYAEQVRESTYGLNYQLSSYAGVNCNACFPPYQLASDIAAGVPGGDIDLDSVLTGRTKINSRASVYRNPDPIDGFSPAIPSQASEAYCNPYVETEYSRFTNPAMLYKGIKQDRFVPLHQDPQCNIFWDFSLNTRQQARDNFRTPWQVPIGQKDNLPNIKLGPKKLCVDGVNCPYAPYNVDALR